METSPRNIALSVIGVTELVAALLGWSVVSSVVERTGGGFGFGVLFFSITAVAFFSASVLCLKAWERIILAFVIPVSSLFFSVTIPHAVVILFSSAFLYRSLGKIRDDADSRLALSFRRSMGAGAFLFTLSVAMLVSSQYYSGIRSSSWENLVPRFSLAESTGDVILRMAGSVSPELGKIRDGRMTVDAFLSTVREPGGYSGNGMDSVKESVVSAISLEMGRAELGKLVGRNVSGAERMGDLLSEALRNKAIAFLSVTKEKRNLPNGALPFFLALLLFMTLLSMGSVLQGVWTALSAGFVRLCIRMGIVSVERVPAEREVLL